MTLKLDIYILLAFVVRVIEHFGDALVLPLCILEFADGIGVFVVGLWQISSVYYYYRQI